MTRASLIEKERCSRNKLFCLPKEHAYKTAANYRARTCVPRSTNLNRVSLMYLLMMPFYKDVSVRSSMKRERGEGGKSPFSEPLATSYDNHAHFRYFPLIRGPLILELYPSTFRHMRSGDVSLDTATIPRYNFDAFKHLFIF